MTDGDARKVVLAREIVVTPDEPFDVDVVLDRLRTTYPGCHVFAVDGFVGASPELLVSRAGDIVRSHPMAGTAPRGGDPTTDARLAASLLASTKDRQEHQITIDMVHDTLLPWCSYLDYEAEPSIVPVANVQHLATLVEGRLSQPAPSVLELVAALHPTPAVCGSPRDEALAFIARARRASTAAATRAPSAGSTAGGNGTWAVSVRCAELDGTVARVYAGNGIVADSDPDTELAETRAKLQAMLGSASSAPDRHRSAVEGGGHGRVELGVDAHVRGAVGADDDEPHAARVDGRADGRPTQRRILARSSDAMPWAAASVLELDAVRRAEQLLEPRRRRAPSPAAGTRRCRRRRCRRRRS